MAQICISKLKANYNKKQNLGQYFCFVYNKYIDLYSIAQGGLAHYIHNIVPVPPSAGLFIA